MEQKLSSICLPRKELILNNIQNQIILGSILGDACISKVSDNCYRFSEDHCKKQEDYLIWKNKFLKFNKITMTRGEVSMNKDNLIFKKFYNLFYPFGRKGKIQITEIILNQLTPLALAIWYIDDGYYLYSTRSIGISTCNFTKKQNELIINWFAEKFNIIFKLSQDKKGYYCIRANVEDTKKFLKLISPITNKMPNCIDYKLGKDNERIERARLTRNKCSRDYRKLNPDRLKKTNQSYYKNNQEKILKQKREYWRKTHGA